MAGIVWLLQRAFGRSKKHLEKKIQDREKTKKTRLKAQAQQFPKDTESIKNWEKTYGDKKLKEDEKYHSERRKRVMSQRTMGASVRKSQEDRKRTIYMAKDPYPDKTRGASKKRTVKEEQDMSLYMKDWMDKKLGKTVKEDSKSEEMLPKDIQTYNTKVREQEGLQYVNQLLKAADFAEASNPFEAARLRSLANEASQKYEKNKGLC